MMGIFFIFVKHHFFLSKMFDGALHNPIGFNKRFIGFMNIAEFCRLTIVQTNSQIPVW